MGRLQINCGIPIPSQICDLEGKIRFHFQNMDSISRPCRYSANRNWPPTDEELKILSDFIIEHNAEFVWS